MKQQSSDASVIVLYTREGKILLEHRTATRKRYADCWALFGGRPEEGETPLQNVLREAQEETGYLLRAPVFLYTQILEKGGKKHVFVEEYDGTQEIILDPRESQGYGWFTFEEVAHLKRIPHDAEPVAKVAEYLCQQHVLP